MCCLTKRKSKCIGGMTLLLLLAPAVNLPAAVAQKPQKFWSRQILNTFNSLSFICYIFSRSNHLDNLQHRFRFLCWNIGTWTQDTPQKLCIAATVSEIMLL
jgi:hypothetical protein